MRMIDSLPARTAQEFFAAQPIGLRVPGWILARSEYPARLRQTRHAHAPAYFSFVVRGGYAETLLQRQRCCHPGDLLFHPAAEEHSVIFQDKTTRILRLELDAALMNRIPLAPRRLQQPMHLTAGHAPWIARRIHAELHRTDRLAPLAIEGLALELLAETFRFDETGGGQVPRWLGRAREIIESCYRERLTLAAIAEQAGAHRVTLARAFRAHFHQTVAERIRELRIRDACRALAAGERSLSEIAAEAGFCDQAHLTRTFRRIMGMTPAQFRTAESPATPAQRRYNRSIR